MSTFWNGYMLQDFIFQGLNTKSVAGFIGIVVALISAGVLYEGLNLLKNKSLQKFFNLRRELIRDQLQERQSSQDDQPIQTTTRNTSSVDLNSQEEVPEDVDDNVNPRNSLINDELYNEIRAGISRLTATQRFTQGHGLIYLFTSSTLHAVYAFSGYTLMNAVMTFNTWILIAVCLGMGIGSLIFRAGTITLPFIENDFQQTQSVEAYAQFTSNEKTDDDNNMSSYQANEDLPSALPIGRRRDFCKDELEENNSQVDDVGAQVMVVGAQVHHDYQQSI